MRILRVLVTGLPQAGSPMPWVVIDASGRVLQHGQGAPADWPATERRDAVIAADAVRLVALDLPPLSKDRLAAAATFALEDRLASPIDDAVVAVGARNAQGRVVVTVVARDLAEALIAVKPAFVRAVAEPELVSPVVGWRWVESTTSAFVRTSDGGAFGVSRGMEEELPPELVLALEQATRAQRGPASIVVDRPAGAASLARWRTQTGVVFTAGTPWQWEAATQSSIDAAIDVIAPSRRVIAPASASKGAGAYTFALWLGAIALAVHVSATAGTWLWQRAQLAQASQALASIAREAGARAPAGDAAQAIALLHADARHRAGLAASDDAMPLLSRAAPALATLPVGTLRTANWTGGAWTLELAPLDDAALATFAHRIAGGGLSVLHAKTANGIRVRVTPSP